MIKFLRQIRQNLIKESQKGKTIICPVRDKLWVETNKDEFKPRAIRYEIYNVPKGTLNQQNKHLLPR